MERKSEVFLNLINAFVYQVESGEAYAQTPGISLDDIEYIGFTLVLGAGDSGTYNCHAYGYEANGVSHIMVLNSSKLFAFIKEYATLTPAEDRSEWKTCILEIPEDTHDATSEFLYGRDAEPWQLPALSISEFVRPGSYPDKGLVWSEEVYKARYGRERVESLPQKRYTGGMENVVDLPASVIIELDEEMDAAIEGLFAHHEDELPAPGQMVFGLTSVPDFMHTVIRHEQSNILTDTKIESISAYDTEPESLPVAARDDERKNEGEGVEQKPQAESRFKWSLGRRKNEVEEPIVSFEAEIKEPKPPTRQPEVIPEDQIIPSLLRYSVNELSNKRIEASLASIIIYLQPPVVTSYGFWYSASSQGHWMPESHELDDAMDAFLRNTIPDRKHPWDACIIRMNLETWELTTEFLTGKQAYPWMESMSHRSTSLSQIAKYRKAD